MKTNRIRIFICDQCQKQFESIRESKYCSSACIGLAHRQKIKALELEIALMTFEKTGANFNDCCDCAKEYIKRDYKRAKRVVEGLGYVYDETLRTFVYRDKTTQQSDQRTA
jgi:hypothetical protein